jgi:hypothetical protein
MVLPLALAGALFLLGTGFIDGFTRVGLHLSQEDIISENCASHIAWEGLPQPWQRCENEFFALGIIKPSGLTLFYRDRSL